MQRLHGVAQDEAYAAGHTLLLVVVQSEGEADTRGERHSGRKGGRGARDGRSLPRT